MKKLSNLLRNSLMACTLITASTLIKAETFFSGTADYGFTVPASATGTLEIFTSDLTLKNPVTIHGFSENFIGNSGGIRYHVNANTAYTITATVSGFSFTDSSRQVVRITRKRPTDSAYSFVKDVGADGYAQIKTTGTVSWGLWPYIYAPSGSSVDQIPAGDYNGTLTVTIAASI